MSYFKEVSINTNNPTGDAFGRVRISSPSSLFDGQLTYGLQPILFQQVTNGTGATVVHDATNRMALMTFAATPTGGKSFMQSYESFRYRAGHSQLIYITFNMNGGVADVVKFAGYSDGTNGVEFQMNGIIPQFKIFSGTTSGNQTIAQSSWNLDKLDGTGASGITLDNTKVQILVIDFQALYVGRVRIGFDIDGLVVWAHQFNHANIIAYPYFQTANLPIRCGMTSTGTVSTTMNFICCTVQSEALGALSEGFHFTQGATVTAASGVLTHLISIQPKLTFNAITNRTKIVIEDLDILVTGNSPVHYEVCLGATLTGTTAFIDANTTYSAVQYNTLGTLSGTPLISIASGHIAASAQAKGNTAASLPSKYPITLDVDGNARLLGRVSILVRGVGGASAVEGSIDWTEIR